MQQMRPPEPHGREAASWAFGVVGVVVLVAGFIGGGWPLILCGFVALVCAAGLR